MNVLLVEDDEGVAMFIRECLAASGYSCDHFTTGREGLAALTAEHAAVVLDLMLPGGMGGLDVLAEIRGREHYWPVLILTAMGGTDDMVHGLNQGADDYLSKPFDGEVLVARLNALTRRAQAGSASLVLRFGEVEMDSLREEVRRNGVEISLTPTERRLLRVLLEAQGEVCSPSELLWLVWKIDFDPRTNLVKTHISNLRRKMEADGASRIVEAVRGVGYRLVAPSQPARSSELEGMAD